MSPVMLPLALPSCGNWGMVEPKPQSPLPLLVSLVLAKMDGQRTKRPEVDRLTHTALLHSPAVRLKIAKQNIILLVQYRGELKVSLWEYVGII